MMEERDKMFCTIKIAAKILLKDIGCLGLFKKESIKTWKFSMDSFL